MATINNFDVLKLMSAENKDIRLMTDVLSMRKVSAGTQITVGVSGDVIGAITSDQLHACLLLYDKKQFEDLKAVMEFEANPISTPLRSCNLHSNCADAPIGSIHCRVEDCEDCFGC